MDKVRVRFVAVLLVLFLALAFVRSEGNRKFLETIFGSTVSWISQDEQDHETVEQIWIHCWKNIDSSSNTIPEFRINHLYEIEKAIDDLPPTAQKSLLDCLTERNILLSKPTTEPVSTTWLERIYDIFSVFSSVPRRQLKSRNRTRRHHRKPENTILDKNNPQRHHKPQAANLDKKHLHHRDESKAAKLNKKHLPQTPNLAFRKKHPSQPHKPQTANVPLREEHSHQRHKPGNTNVPRHKNRPDQHHKPQNATLPFHKKHPIQKQNPQTDTLTIQKLPRDPINMRANRANISPLGISNSLALSLSRTPTPAPSPAPIHISPEPYTPAPSPVADPPSLDTLAPPSPVKPSPVGVSPLASPANSEDDTSRYAFLIGIAVGSAVAILAIMSLIFFCCLKRVSDKVGPKDWIKDENPLLNICLSRGIEDSGEKTQGEGYSKQKILNTTILIDNSTYNNETSSPHKPTETTTQTNKNAPLAVPPPPGKTAPPPLSAPPPPPPKKSAAPPPPPPKGGVKPPPPPLGKPLPRQRGRSSLGGSDDANGGSDSHKAKLKPFFWDKVSPDQSMVWQELKAGSFQVNEEMMETLFGYTVAEKTINNERKGSSPAQFIQIIDPKKSQNLSILLKALNVTTEEVCDALMKGNELPGEFIQALLKMAPTSEEELKLRLYNGELSLLGPAERFLKSVVEIPFAFKRMESLLFISSVQEEVSSINDAFKTLEVACTELKKSRLFLKLLEAVLKTGNRMNNGTYRGDAQAFKLDTLLKLSDVKGTDGKTTLLHFVVKEIIRSEGVRSARTLRESQSLSSLNPDDLIDISSPDDSDYYRSLGLEVVLGLSNDLENVRKAAVIDGDGVSSTVYKLGHSLGKIKNFLENEIEGLEEESEFRKKIEKFVKDTEDEIKRLVGEEKRIMDLVKGTVEYFYGKGAKNEGLRLFVIVRDFLVILEKVCKEVKSAEKMPVRAQRREAMTPSTSSDSIDIRHQKLFPAITANRRDDSSSDDDSF